MTTYAELSSRTMSEKAILAILEAVDQFKLFTLHSGSVYYRDVDHFVTGVKQGSTSLTEGASSSLSAGQFFFDAKAKRLYVRMSDSSNPKTKDVSATYKLFFSNASHILPCDLDSGEEVEFDARVESIGNLGQQLDEENTGIVLESSSSISLINNDGFFDNIFDTLIWENQAIEFFSWSPSIPVTEAQRIFSGVIESKDFSSSTVTFKVKDFAFKLKNKLNMPIFSDADGTVAPSLLGRPKRRIYGQVKQLKCAGIDCVLGGFPLTGNISVDLDSVSVTGIGTSFLTELNPGDELIITQNGTTLKLGVQSIETSTTLTLGTKSSEDLTAVSATVKPSIPYRFKNREWSIAGHKLRAPTSTITSINKGNRVTGDTTLDFFEGDPVKINDEYVTIRRLSGNKFVFNSVLFPAPDIGDLIEKNPVSKVFFKDKELIIDRDWTLTNTTEAILTIDPLAEFNIAEQRSIGVSLTFTNGSRSITTASVVDLRTILKPRDWVRKNSLTETTWYEVLDVNMQTITIRTSFTGVTATTTGLMKNVDLIDDDALITVDCMGMEDDGEWVKTPSNAVRHLVTYDALFDSINEDTFTKANSECNYILSLPIPTSLGESSPDIKSVITKINESVFGSLYGDTSSAISYSILNSKKPEDPVTLKDDDIISFEVSSTQRIINSITVNYRPFTDIYSGSDTFETYTQEGEFVNRLIGINNTDEKTLYLYEEDKAKIIAQRMLFFRSLSSCKVLVKAKLNLSLVCVNDKIFLDLDRLYKRYGGRDRKKVGVVTGVKKNGSDVEVEFTDLGNIYNRTPSIAPNDASDYPSATGEERVKWGYILDNDTLTPDVLSENELGNNLIG